MKILFISMRSIHAIRWIENLKDTNHELYWFDILNSGFMPINANVNQITNWQIRKMPYIKGEHFLRKNLPNIYSFIEPIMQVSIAEQLEILIQKIQPDIVHSFEMQSCSYPIVKIMNRYKNLPWIYSCWGTDLFYYQNNNCHLNKIKSVLKRVNFLHTDCERDYHLAVKLGFLGRHLGVIPGGTGFKIEELNQLKLPIAERKIILVKGYQHLFGRALSVVKALERVLSKIENYKVVIYGTHKEVVDYVYDKKLPFEVFDRHALSHQQVLEYMGKSIIAIGNSISDGMSNTLLEAIVMGAFPIQSNPGGVSAEIILNNENGLLIETPDDSDAVASIILKALSDFELLQKANYKNSVLANERLNYDYNKQKVIEIYSSI